MMKFTVFGSKGFIGSAFCNYLKSQNIEYSTPDIKNKKIPTENLGHVIYAVGVLDSKQYPIKTVDSHVFLLNKLLNETDFDSFLYISSTRIYYNASSTDENSLLLVNPSNFDNVYNISKIMGEVICNISKKQNVRIIRLSNVVGNNFYSNLSLPSMIRDAIKFKKIILQTSLDSEKDFVHIDDVVDIIQKIAVYGKNTVYNVANGKNLTNEKIVEKIQEITKCELEIIKNATTYSFLPISIKRIQKEFNFKSKPVLNKFEKIIHAYQNKILD